MPFNVGRRFHVKNQTGVTFQGAFGDWDIDIPHIEGIIATSVGWTVAGGYPDLRCTDFGAAPAAAVISNTEFGPVTTNVPFSEYSNGFTIVVPGSGRHELLYRASGNTNPAGYPVVSKDWWASKCVTRYGLQTGTPDEGFEVKSPDGVTYEFTQYSARSYPSYQRPADTTQSGVMAVVARQEAWFLPDTITDRFGNTVSYTYQTVNGQLMPHVITASDGRTITITYTGDIHQFYNGRYTNVELWLYVQDH